MAPERRLFPEEFKREATRLAGQPGASKAAIARDLGIGANLLGRWCCLPLAEIGFEKGSTRCKSSLKLSTFRCRAPVHAAPASPGHLPGRPGGRDKSHIVG